MSPLFSYPAESPFITGAYVPCPTGCAPDCYTIVTPSGCEIYDYGVLKCCPLGWNRDDDPEGEQCALLGQQEYLDTTECLNNGLKVEWFALPTPSNESDCINAGGIWYPAVSQTVCPSPSGAFCGVTFTSPIPCGPPCYTCDISDELFLNCYVVGFSGKLGLGPTETSVTVELVERGVNRPCDDPCPIINLSNPLTQCDPLPSPIDNYQYNGMIGNIYSFNLGNFCFTGVLTNHRYSESSDGYRYSVTLTDARNVLSKTMVIVKGYYDDLPTELKPNVINIAYKLQTSVGDDSCGDGTRCDNFGVGNVDQECVSVNTALFALDGEYCQMPVSGTFLKINLTPLLNLIKNDSIFSNIINKLEEDHLSVIDLVVKATEDIGYDFYCEIIGNEIVFKPINRSTQPTSNDLFNLLTSNGLADSCSNRDYGQELTFNATKRLVRGSEMTYFTIIDGQPSGDPEPSPSVCGRTLYPCYKREPGQPITKLPGDMTKADCKAQESQFIKTDWYGIDQVYVPGSFGHNKYNYGSIIGGSWDSLQSEIQDSIIIVDALPNNNYVNVINRNTIYRLRSDETAQNNNYYKWMGPLPTEGYTGSFGLTTNSYNQPAKPTFPLPSPPNPSCSPYPSFSPQPNCNSISAPDGNILMYFGSEFKPDPGCTTSPCPTYTTVYVADGEDFKVMAHRSDANGRYVDYNYSCQELIDAGILSSGFNGGKPYFVLTEMELLHTGTPDGWYNFGVLRDDYCDPQSFAFLCMQDIGYDIKPLRDRLIGFITNNLNNQKETASFAQTLNTIVTMTMNYFKVTTNFTDVQQSLKSDKLLACYEWIKKIYDTYYGKQFLIKVGEHSIKIDQEISIPAQNNICLKKFDYQNGTSLLLDPTIEPLVISGNGDSQGYLISDQISTNGAFPSEKMIEDNPLSLLGLKYSSDINDNFLTNEGNIEPFIKFGTVAEAATPKVYRKYGWDNIVDMSLFNNENSYIKKDNAYSNTDLYLRVNAVDELYFLLYKNRVPDVTQISEIDKNYGGVYALLTVQQPVYLLPAKIYGVTAAMAYFSLLNDEIRKSIHELRSKSGTDGTSFDPNQLFGAKPDYSILNQAFLQKRTIMPEGAAVALKSNLYSYGPYYHIKNRTGSAEIITEPDIYPAFFNNDPLVPKDSYEKMHNMGKRLCQDGVNGVQQVETGTYTIHNLPSLSLGYLTGNPLSPVLLNDMSVTFGSGGFSTTYNFETYTPRFGSPARHILDQYKVDKKQADYINSQRRIDKRNILNINRDINLKRNQLRIEQNNNFIPDVSYKYRSTPHTLLITGFAFKGSVSPEPSPAFNDNTNNTNLRPQVDTDTYESLSKISDQLSDNVCCGGDPLPPCESCACPSTSPSASPSQSPFPSHSGNIYTITTFAENRNSYDFGHLQETFGNLAVMSVDGLYLPVSIRGGILVPHPSGSPNIDLYNKSISRYGAVGSSLTSSKPKMPVFRYKDITQYNLAVNNKYLNPIISRIMLVGASPSLDSWDSGWDARKNGTNQGFVINSIAFGDDFDKFRLSHNVESEFYRQDSSDFRFNALRGPLVLQGWGYDTNGKPIPNHADNPKDTEEGKFYDKNLTDKFMKDWLRNPRTWPVGPIDLRFDRERKVWVCPPPDRIVLAQLDGELEAGGSAFAKLINIESDSEGFYENTGLWDQDGRNIKPDLKNTKITVYDYLGLKIKDKSLIYAYYDGSKYIVLNSRDRAIDDCCWYGLDELKNIPSYDKKKKQALIHKPSYKGDNKFTECPSCLAWEDIIECSPSPSPKPDGCACDNLELSLSNFNPGGGSAINITFPYRIKDMSVKAGGPTFIEDNDPDPCYEVARFDLGAAKATCKGTIEDQPWLVKYELVFDIEYKRCCDPVFNEIFTDCSDTITIMFGVSNLPPADPACDCETGNDCVWSLVDHSTSNCEDIVVALA